MVRHAFYGCLRCCYCCAMIALLMITIPPICPVPPADCMSRNRVRAGYLSLDEMDMS